MLRGLYTSATGMGIEQFKQESITNNMANVSTVGYKKDTTVFQSFPELLVARIDQEKNKVQGNVIGKVNLGALIGDTITNFKDGALEETGNPYNFAISGEAFFVVQTPEGERYTRDGNFSLDSEGFLVTQDGYRVLGEKGPIRKEEGDFVVTPKGEVLSGTESLDNLMLKGFENPNSLKKLGKNLFALGPQTEQKELNNYTIHQNYLEKPNINLVEEMVEMMAVVRAFETNQKLIQAHDELLGKSVNEVGTVK